MKRFLITVPLVLGDTPIVNLLPPGVKQREKIRLRRRILVLLVGAALAFSAGTYVIALNDVRNDNDSLTVAQTRSQDLLTQERGFSGAATVTAQGDELRAAEKIVGSADILWAPLLASIDQAVNASALVTSISALSDVKWATAPASVGVLEPEGIGTASLVVEFSSIDGLQGIIDSLITLTGVSHALPGAIIANANGFSTTITLTFDTAARSNRYIDASTGTR